jgi:hypothetical protein
MTPPGAPLLVIGRQEYVDFPEWPARRVRAKVDTGACTSALDVVEYQVRDEGPGGHWVEALVALHRKRPPLRIRAPVVRMTTVRNSGGEAQLRPVIEALVRLGPVSRRLQITLARRDGMRFRMILGRRALAGAFLVDVSRTYLQRGL